MPSDFDKSARDERRAITVESIKRKLTQIDRWATLEGHPLWEARAQALAPLIPEGSRVVDIGCGTMALEKYLPKGCTYVPVDVTRRDERTIVSDLNKDKFPEVTGDVAVCLGVLEYLFNVPLFLRRLGHRFPMVILTYYPLEHNPGFDRLAVGWVNALNCNEIQALLKYAGFTTIRRTTYKKRISVFCAERAPVTKR